MVMNQATVNHIPDPRGRKSLPTTLSNTDDFPELWFSIFTYIHKNQSHNIQGNILDQKNDNERIKKCDTCPPTTATEGRASQSDKPSPPWSPKTVHARWILLMRPIKLVIVAILGSDEDENEGVDECGF
jgi:hypothetical protein